MVLFFIINTLTFQETINFIYSQLPVFQKIGAPAFNKGLDKTLQLLAFLGDPHEKFKSIHVAGTNGKGSVSSMLAAVLQQEGYKTGLYTSPHLKRFTERIRVNGLEIPEDYVVDFVEKMRELIERVKPSFFELTVAMAFDHFARSEVEVALVEVGMGGRLDSTNVIHPILSLITNISLDHQEFLGNKLPEIAGEKAGIIKEKVPVLISEKHPETIQVFRNVARQKHADIFFTEDLYRVSRSCVENGFLYLDVLKNGAVYLSDLACDLTGDYQLKNIPTVIVALELLKEEFPVSFEALRFGLKNVRILTGLKGRWQILSEKPLTICDTGHNEVGIGMAMSKIHSLSYDKFHIVFGMVKDKDRKNILKTLPQNAVYYFCKPSVDRGVESKVLADEAYIYGLVGACFADVNQALREARKQATEKDVIFIGGSTFTVADLDEI